jgi:hypothetical protein
MIHLRHGEEKDGAARTREDYLDCGPMEGSRRKDSEGTN